MHSESPPSMQGRGNVLPPYRQIRASHNDVCIRIYQAYSDAIADSVLTNGVFICPPFKMDRMTWIKPSFLWMMYRSGWGKKDEGQKRILAIDITRAGFEWALEHSLLTNQEKEFSSKDLWLKAKMENPVRIQWDPERDLHLQPLEYRTIQIGLTSKAVHLYVNEWIKNITEVTGLASEISSLISQNQLENAKNLLPIENAYPLTKSIEGKIQASSS